MTDTRKKANRGDYEKEQEFNKSYCDYLSDPKNKTRKPEMTVLPGNGLIGAKIHTLDLANNGLAIENFLRGTGSANMINPSSQETPDIKNLKSLNLFENCVYMPDPLVIHKGERPNWS